MALQVPAQQSANLFKEGYKHFVGIEEAVIRNINAINELVQILSTSYGPNGRNKLIVNHLLKHFVTSDASTILREIEVNHPAAKLIMDCASAQQQETGDLTNYVCILAAQSLNYCIKLLQWGIAPSVLSEAFVMVKDEALKALDAAVIGEAVWPNSPLVADAIRTAISAKQSGLEDLLTALVLEAITIVQPKQQSEFDVDRVRVVKILGGSIYESTVISGMVFHREPEGNVKNVQNAKVAIFTCPLDIASPETKGTVLINSADELANYSKLEEQKLLAELTQLKDVGVNVIVTGGSLNELATHFCDRLEIAIVRCPSKFELRRLCRVVNAVAMTRIGAPTKEELGHADIFETIEIGSDRCTVFRQTTSTTKTATVLLRGGTQPFLDDVERGIEDGVMIFKALTKDARVVAGAGACECFIAKSLRKVKVKYPGLETKAFDVVADAFEAIPRIIAENSGFDVILINVGTEIRRKH